MPTLFTLQTDKVTEIFTKEKARLNMNPHIAIAIEEATQEGRSLCLLVGMKAPPSTDDEDPPGPTGGLPGTWKFLWGTTWSVELAPGLVKELFSDKRIASIGLSR